MSFQFRPAERETTSLIIGLAGASSSGKTMTSILLGLGFAYPDMTPDQIMETVEKEGRSRVAVIDTEGARALHYAPKPGQRPDFISSFPFQHGDLKAPFTPKAYEDAIAAADDAGFAVIIVDSFSHCYEGPGGILEQADQLAAGVPKPGIENPEPWKRDQWIVQPVKSPGNWIAPKSAWKRMVNRLLQCRATVIVCMRAEEKMQLIVEEGPNGKKTTKVVPAADRPVNERWEPIVEKRFCFETTCTFILTPSDPGIGIPIKLQEQHRSAFPLGERIGVKSGWALAQWASGAISSPQARVPPQPKIVAPAEKTAEPPPQTDLLGDRPQVDEAKQARLDWAKKFIAKVARCQSVDAITELFDAHEGALKKMRDGDAEIWREISAAYDFNFNRLSQQES